MDSDFKKIYETENKEETSPPTQNTQSIYPSAAPHTQAPPPTAPRVLSMQQLDDTATQHEPVIPYLASLTAFVLLLISTFYSLFSLIDYALKKMLIKETADSAANVYGSYFSSFDNYLVISALAAFIISLPATVAMAFIVRKYEAKEEWRFSQKWRRFVYIAGAIVLIVGIVGTLVGMVYTIISTSINLDADTYSYSYYSEEDAPKPDKGSIVLKAILSGISGVFFLGFGLFVLGSNYANKRRMMMWVVFGILLFVGLGVGTYGVIKVQESIKKAEKAQKASSAEEINYQSSTSSSDYSSSDTTTSTDYTTTDLQDIQGDLEYYYAAENSYPTKAQWDDGSLKQKYLVSSDDVIKETTYTPEGCDDTGCKSYTISMKDENGKTQTLKSEN